MADRGRGRGGGRGGARGASNPQQGNANEKPAKREAILDLAKYESMRIRVKFQGGREVTGVLKGFDQLMNLVLDDVVENLSSEPPKQRNLGLVVLRGPTITLLSPVDGWEEIENPFLQGQS
ncbi:U6 snRNA-associated Sm-like protein LSm7 [Dacryopinax primogenitus]|uniref:U6 snRNA-associated Sm-like protein LSm7 n=1 Tax=Dacryopinax primogenitus (strain DJM 731) TaxID=1858805 RepID=M5FX22_DACPD|nr:U6 snRNA-associated Sm-like protein LSm7 [Dacryopinax primogenitus]EJU00260.1 U6 snRNA-associated Sm-like protein LSm7 [Dacryopinax primogenitus]